jgi:hypothetical protein
MNLLLVFKPISVFALYRVFQKKLYNFEGIYAFINKW